MKQHQRGDIPHVDWLDSLVFRKLERVHAAEMETTDDLLLYVDLPEVAVPVVFAEPEPGLEGEVPSASGGAPGTEPEPRSAQLAPIVDPAADGENLVEAKHRRLVRSQRTGLLDRDQKPTAAARDELRTILLTPPSHVLSPGEMDLVWSYRFYLTRDPKGLTKFLKSVVWSDAYESRQATEVLLPMWAEAEMSDALELLGPAFRDLRVRAYAVRRLHKAADEELALYLLQLVQALKFDEAAWRAAGTSSIRSDASSADDGVPERLCELLLRRSVANVSLGATFYWYVTVEAEGVVHGRMYRRIEQELLQRIAAHRSPLAEMLVRQRRFVATLSDRCKELRFSRDARPRKIERLHAMLADTRGGLRRDARGDEIVDLRDLLAEVIFEADRGDLDVGIGLLGLELRALGQGDEERVAERAERHADRFQLLGRGRRGAHDKRQCGTGERNGLQHGVPPWSFFNPCARWTSSRGRSVRRAPAAAADG